MAVQRGGLCAEENDRRATFVFIRFEKTQMPNGNAHRGQNGRK